MYAILSYFCRDTPMQQRPTKKNAKIYLMITILICKSQVKNTGPAQLSKFGLPKWIHYDEKGAPNFLTFIRQSIAVLVRNNEKNHTSTCPVHLSRAYPDGQKWVKMFK